MELDEKGLFKKRTSRRGREETSECWKRMPLVEVEVGVEGYVTRDLVSPRTKLAAPRAAWAGWAKMAMKHSFDAPARPVPAQVTAVYEKSRRRR